MNIRLKKCFMSGGLFVFPIFHFYLLEAYTHNGLKEIRPWSQFFNIILFEVVAIILFFLFRNLKAALMTEGIFAMILGLVNYYVYSFRSLPLVPWDILSIGTAFHVADNYDFTPTISVIAVAAGFLLVLFLESRLEVTLHQWKWYGSFFCAVIGCVILGVFMGVLQQEDFQNRHKMYNKLFTPVRVWQVNGFALTMVMELPYVSIDKPLEYNRDEAEEILASYEKKEQTLISTEKLPHIIVIMDEAFSDLGVLGEFQSSEDYMPYIRSLLNGAENSISGYLNVSICGGNTANTEFEFLTGNTMAFLPKGSIPYQQYIKNEVFALPAYLQKLGYETHAMHPYNEKGWDRDSVYPLLGFSHMDFLKDYENREYIRDYVSDKTCMEKIIETFEQRESGQPLFIFNVTMQNHGSYGEVYENFSPHILVEGVSSYSLSSYLSLIQKTDEALKELIWYFSKVDEPVLVVFFGDHQPNDTVAEPILRLNGMSYRTLTEEQTKLRYQVPYAIWTNYEMDTVTHADTSANYLGVKMLEAAGIELPAYYKFLEELQEAYPIISSIRMEQSSDAKVDLEDYEKLQYYQLFDRKEEGN